jgi:hypothetical protein
VRLFPVPLGIAVGVPVFVGLLSALGGLANQFALQSRKGVLSLHAQNCAMYGVGFVVNATTVMYSRTVTERASISRTVCVLDVTAKCRS